MEPKNDADGGADGSANTNTSVHLRGLFYVSEPGWFRFLLEFTGYIIVYLLHKQLEKNNIALNKL